MSVGIASSAATTKICVITAVIKNFKSIIEKRKHDKIILLAKTKLNTLEILISKALINSNISHAELFSINNVPKKYDDLKKEIKITNNK